MTIQEILSEFDIEGILVRIWFFKTTIQENS